MWLPLTSPVAHLESMPHQGIGVSCVVAQSFAGIFFRNAINIGLLILECIEAAERADFMLELISAGGLVEHTRRKVGISD